MFNIKTFLLKSLVVSRFLLIFAEEIITNKTKRLPYFCGRYKLF